MNTLFVANKKATKPTKPKQITDSFEIFRETPKVIKQEAKSAVTDAAGDFWKQLLGVDNKKAGSQKNGDLKPGQSLNLKDTSKTQENKPASAAALDYGGEIMRSSEQSLQRENAELKQTIQQLIAEIKQVSKSNGAMEGQVAQATQNVTKAGKYHVTFFQHIFSILRASREKASLSASWSNAVKGKKRGIHKLMKTNMQVAMSGERAAGTSAS